MSIIAGVVAFWLVLDIVSECVTSDYESALGVDTRPIKDQHHIAVYIDMELPAMTCMRLLLFLHCLCEGGSGDVLCVSRVWL